MSPHVFWVSGFVMIDFWSQKSVIKMLSDLTLRLVRLRMKAMTYCFCSLYDWAHDTDEVTLTSVYCGWNYSVFTTAGLTYAVIFATFLLLTFESSGGRLGSYLVGVGEVSLVGFICVLACHLKSQKFTILRLLNQLIQYNRKIRGKTNY